MKQTGLNNLEMFIAKQIELNGSMPLGEFMSIAMTHPEYGYYTNSYPIGVDGDFITAPEISQIFGEMIGAWIIDVWIQMGSPELNLIECGAGHGTLMADIMRVGEKVSEFADLVNIYIIETQGNMRGKQKSNLRPYKVSWYETINKIKADKPCIIIGNEFLDALPIEQLKRGNNGWQQRFVDFDGNVFKFIWKKADKFLLEFLPKKTLSNKIYEISKAQIGFIKKSSSLIEKSSGAALFIDYGHNKSNYGETLQAVKKHKYSDVLKNIGRSDITSHVDFAALKRNIPSDIISPFIVTQRNFLLSLGIEHRANALITSNADMEVSIKKQLERLISKDQMGDLFKVMCFYNCNIKPCGFS